MLSRLIMILNNKSSTKLSVNMSSLFHGALIGFLDERVAAALHEQSLNPYTQHISISQEKILWIITTMTEQAYKNIIMPLLSDSIQSIKIEYHDLELYIESKDCKTIDYDTFLKENYFRDYDRYFTLRFLTPTAFKSGGLYRNYPTVRWIVNSLAGKTDAFGHDVSVSDKEVLSLLEESIVITKYSLKSTQFSLEGVRIPSFIGWITVCVKNNQSIVNLCNYLFKYGEYSGVGIKTSIGMGAIEVESRERRSNN